MVALQEDCLGSLGAKGQKQIYHSGRVLPDIDEIAEKHNLPVSVKFAMLKQDAELCRTTVNVPNNKEIHST